MDLASIVQTDLFFRQSRLWNQDRKASIVEDSLEIRQLAGRSHLHRTCCGAEMTIDVRDAATFKQNTCKLPNGLKYHYVDQSPASGYRGTCLLLHGFPDSWSVPVSTLAHTSLEGSLTRPGAPYLLGMAGDIKSKHSPKRVTESSFRPSSAMHLRLSRTTSQLTRQDLSQGT